MSRLTAVTATLVRFDLRRFLIGGLLWMPASALPLVGGLILQRMFDHLTVGRVPLLLCAAFVGVELVRGLTIVIAWTYGDYWWSAAAALLRGNVLRSILSGKGRVPHSSGEALARLRDDAADVVEFVDESVPLAGAALFSAAALAIMVSIHPAATLALIVPALAIGVASRLLNRLTGRLHRQGGGGGGAVTGHLGEIFTGVLAIKTAGAEKAALERLRAHNRLRRDAAVKDRLATDLLTTATGASVEIGVGLVLLLAAPAMRRGEFTAGDLALFTTYIGWLTALPRTVGSILARMPQAAVSTERLTRMTGPDDSVSRDSGVWFHRDYPAPEPAAHDDPLKTLQARGLAARHGLHGVDLEIERGTLTVITGAVGSGKTTLLRTLLGLEPAAGGTICWNGSQVADPGGYLVPGRAAYVGQVPRLFSATLRENLLLGRDPEHIERAVGAAAFDRDLAALPDGLDTVVGPRGMRLSGGQAQRVTVARALVRSPDLLVVDDLSSALDVETEQLLWERITGAATLLVVSHRPAVLARADQVVVLDRGRVAGRGTLDELLESCAEMRRLWSRETLDTRDGLEAPGTRDSLATPETRDKGAAL
ncbi:HlyB/MsbA family ABC transporter [Streptomyces bingchenggensis BCW-1]|uniref:HlyB/MsbA family ABC transporter n=1 Tax=Streptomyces bingchenggensis (strain BCW-1) TaxID=749414 RepID=D7C1T3_STRBB|nr:ABC transporter ATP-binding protein [Streptomyces bingchenggensis]ADI12134.1 HlyB/MsbA family ABC transporter [Streptomyces bingchenggensis BCW-1]